MKLIEQVVVVVFSTWIAVTAAFVVPSQRHKTSHCLPGEDLGTNLNSIIRVKPQATNASPLTLSLLRSTNNIIKCPETSPATGLTNHFYSWKNEQQIRYQTTSIADSATTSTTATLPILFIHGLFTNSDHWRHSLRYFSSMSDKKYTAYAIDLYGCGYSDKPLANSTIAQACNGEYRRFDVDTNSVADGILRDVQLGSPNGQPRSSLTDVELRHPIGSPYNFYTWADLITDFCKDVIIPASQSPSAAKTVTLVCNSIGTMSSLQAAIDHPNLFNGVFVVSPNFRELHSAEVPFPSLTMPILQVQQRLLRDVIGQPLFDALAKPDIVRDILKVPYANIDAVDDELVEVLLDPLLTSGASNVVFDTLSYSAGPLPEPQLQQLSEMRNNNTTSATSLPVWVCYGSDDPWTPGRRVEALQTTYNDVVEKVVCFPGVGHCPHDEAPELVHPLLIEFLQRVTFSTKSNTITN